MPTISVDKEDLYVALGQTYTTEEFDELCFEFGIELDEDTTEEVERTKTGERPELKIEIPANRYDLLCFEGISRALLVFLGKMKPPAIRAIPAPPGKETVITLSPDTAKIRPYFAGAILRNVKFTQQSYDSFIDLQDKLHQNLARRRTLVAIGTHDLNTIQAPFTYEALPPTEINFAPLNNPKSYRADEMMTLFESDRHLSRYLHIIRDSPIYPIIYDQRRNVLSMPPIINSNHSKITMDTKNVFIDVTATDKTKLDVVINILVSMFSCYAAEPFTVEPVKVIYPDGSTVVTPDVSSRRTTAHVSYINACTGLKLSPAEICSLLTRMGHVATPSTQNADELVVNVPPTRPDILHECDLMEDVAIAYGFNNLPKTLPSTNTVAQQYPVNKLSDVVRKEIAMAGWTEVLPLILCSHDENFAFLNRKDDGTTAVVLENPKTSEYQVVRTSLLPGLLKSIRENRKHPLPHRIFEVSDVGVKSERAEDAERRSRNIRRVCAVYSNKAAEFEVVHGLLDRIMAILGVPRISKDDKSSVRGYYLEEATDLTFFPGRAATIHYRPSASVAHSNPVSSQDTEKGTVTDGPLDTIKSALSAALPTAVGGGKKGDIELGKVGVLHPEVLGKFDIDYPCSGLEFDLEPFV